MNKKFITAVSMGSAATLVQTPVITKVVEPQQISNIQEIESDINNLKFHNDNDGNLNTNLVNDAEITQDLYVDELIVIKEPTSKALNEEFNKHVNPILKKFNSLSKHVTITYVPNSAMYDKNLCHSKFVAAPHEGHAWVDDSTDIIEFMVEILNVEVDDKIVDIKNDAFMPFADDFSYPIFLDKMTDKDLDEKLDVLNLNLEDFSRYFLKHFEYKNVSIKYIPQSACYEDSTFKMEVIPKKDHYWENGTKNSYISKVSLKNIYQKSIQHKYANVSNLTTFNKPITIDRMDPNLLNELLKKIEWNNEETLQFYKGAELEDVIINYVVDSVSIDESNNVLIALNVVPKSGFVWKNTNHSTNKTFYVNLENINVLNKPEEINDKKNLDISSKKIYIPNSKQIDLWWNKKFSNENDILEQIFSDENLWKIFEKVENDIKGVRVLYWIKNSPKLLSWSQASIDLGVEPKDGYVWDDRQTYERKLRIIVSGFYIDV